MAQIIVLNGVPRSGKTTIARAILELEPGWVNHGVDAEMQLTEPELLPGVGLRPGDDLPLVRQRLPELYDRFWNRVRAFADQGSNVVVDVGIYEQEPVALGRRLLEPHVVRWVEVRCSLAEVLRRRADSPGYVSGSLDDPAIAPVRRWHDAVYGLGLEPDVSVDTVVSSAAEIAPRLVAARS